MAIYTHISSNYTQIYPYIQQLYPYMPDLKLLTVDFLGPPPGPPMVLTANLGAADIFLYLRMYLPIEEGVRIYVG